MSLTLTRRHNVDRFGYLIPTKYGNLPMMGAVATYRPGEGRFGGAVAVEEGTTNLVPSNRLKFEGWIASSGAQVTLTQNVEFPEIGRNDATRIRTTGGTSTLKYYTTIERSIADQAYTGSVYIKNIGSKPVQFYTQFGPRVTVNPGEWTRAIVSGIGDGVANFQFRFEALNVDDDLDFIAWGPQVEYKPFATSFVDGTRAAGRLEYPQSIWNHATGTFAAWVKTPTDVTTDRVLTLQWAKGDITTNSRFGIRLNTSGRFVVCYGSQDTLTTADSYNDGEWHHVALTWVDGTADIHFYVDGERVASASKPISLSNPGGRWGGVIPIGHRGFTYRDQWWNGLIDELLILPYAASEEEIASWYEAPGPLPPHPDALLQWDWQAVRPATMVVL